jgi:hypothetical protein
MKGHAIEVCHANMYCDICASQDHVRLRCPKFWAARLAAVPCGYAVEGLGFFHVPFELSQQHRNETHSALISVFDGSLSVQNVVFELERLIPGTWKWNVEESGNNTFKTMFPSKSELQRMAEWGVVHSKFQNAKFRIEERLVDNEAMFVLPKVWIQFMGLPSHLHDFLVIWAVEAIMGVSKDVDIEFTRQHEICRMQVMAMNPNLIPQMVNVVIGESVYELKFCVEVKAHEGVPLPMDLDKNHEEDRDGQRERSGVKPNEDNLNQGTKSGSGGASSAINRSHLGAGNLGLARTVFFIQAPHGLEIEGQSEDAEGRHAADCVVHLADGAVPSREQGQGGAEQEEGAVVEVPEEDESS